jgi:hypothetical protein
VLLIRQLLLGVALPAVVSAQPASVTIPRLPLPGSAVRMTMTQDLHFDLSAPAFPQPMKLDGAVLARFLQRTGTLDSAGTVTSDLGYDTLSVSITVNGMAMGSPAVLAGEHMTIRYDSTGQIVEFNAPPELEQRVANLRQLLISSLGGLPAGTMSPGDSTVSQVSAPIPLDPGMGSTPLLLTSTVTSRLRSVSRDSGQVIARFDRASNGNLSGEVTMPMLGKGTMTLVMTGTGTMEIDVGRGLIRSGSHDTRMELTVDVGGGSTMTMVGSLRTTTRGEPSP